VFHIADNAVWLTDSVPAIYLRELADSAHAGMENESGVK
jgi:putative RNA 2'-phosphotransferase